MASHVQVILRQDVENLGRAGELVKVRPGHARNYLLPREMAALASRSNIRQVEHERQGALTRAKQERQSAEALAAQIEGQSVVVSMQAGEGDKLYGSVTNRDVADALARLGVDIDRRTLQIPDTIKSIGEYELSVKLGSEVTAGFKLVVKRL